MESDPLVIVTLLRITCVEWTGQSMSEAWRPTVWGSWRRQQRIMIMIWHTLGREGIHRIAGQTSHIPLKVTTDANNGIFM